MKRVVNASSTSYGATARKVLKDLRQLSADLDDLYMVNEDEYDALDLSSLHDEVQGSVMFVAQQIEGV